MTGTYRMTLPEQVEIGDITVRDGLQALEHYFPLEKKLVLAEELILAGFKRIEVTNLGNPKFMPQFKDAEELLERLFQSKRVGSGLRQIGGDVLRHLRNILKENDPEKKKNLIFSPMTWTLWMVLQYGSGPSMCNACIASCPVGWKGHEPSRISLSVEGATIPLSG